jgi:hypothetical protein
MSFSALIDYELRTQPYSRHGIASTGIHTPGVKINTDSHSVRALSHPAEPFGSRAALVRTAP